MKKIKMPEGKYTKWILIGALALAVLAIGGAAVYKFTQKPETPSASASTTGSAGSPSADLSAMKAVLDTNTFYSGIYINGVNVSGKTKDEAVALFEDQPTLTTPELTLSLLVEGKSYPLDKGDLMIQSDMTALIDEAYAYGRTSAKTDETEALTERYATVTALEKTPMKFESAYKTDPDAIGKAVDAILLPLASDVKDAVVTGFDTATLAFTIEPSTNGLTFNARKAAEDVAAAIESGDYDAVITVDTKVVKPKVTTEDLSKLGLVSTTTTKTTDIANRNANIDLICKTIDGLVLQPGESFNFNNFIGKRTAEKGYKMAGGIFDGTTRNELGGGICQANGTLYNSVMKADLQVDERHPHSWPSTYVPIGQDATVTWGGANFQFTNNTEYPIAIHAVYKDRTVTVEIYGRPIEDGMTIEIENSILSESSPGPTLYVADPTLPVGKTNTVRSAHNAISAVSYKVWYKDGVEVKREKGDDSYYRAIQATVQVGVRAPDGTICAMDPNTGAVAVPAAPAPVAPAPTDPAPAPTNPVTPAPTDPVTPAPTDPVTPAPTDPATPAPTDPTPAP
jgi:vancomycin resistance protein YoaR